MKAKRVFIPLLCLTCFFAACEKPDDRPCYREPSVTQVPAFFYDYIFRDSSQWIYTSSIDTTMDTVTMWDMTHGFYEWESAGGTSNMTGGCPTLYYKEEQFNMRFHGTRSGDYTERIIRERVFRSGEPGGTSLFEGSVGQSLDQCIIEAVHDTLVVHGHVFENVIQVYTTVGAISEPGVLALYYCPEVGVVRTDVRWGSTVYNRLDLIEWHVTPYSKQW